LFLKTASEKVIGASRGSYRQFAIALTEGGEARLGIALQWTRVWSSSEYKYSLLLNVAEAAPVFTRPWAKTKTFFESRKSSIIECNCMFLCLFVCSCLSFSLSFFLSFFLSLLFEMTQKYWNLFFQKKRSSSFRYMLLNSIEQ